MRVTNHASTLQAINAITASRSSLEDVLARLSSGRRVNTASDDPGAALGIMQNEAQLRAREQYRRNIGSATSRVNLEDSVLSRLTDLITRARELAVSQGSDTATPATRAAVAREAEQLLSDAVQLAATKFDNEFLFGGVRSDAAPFSLDTSGAAPVLTVATPAPVGTRAVEIAAGQRFTATHDGLTVFGDDTTGPLAALTQLTAALASGDGAAVRDALPALDTALSRTQTLIAETGARANQLQSVELTHTLVALDLEANISDLRDVDLETALTELAGRQTAYQAAMAATARVAGLSLADYIR
ncbi:MAG: flagellar hook-associated protein FlgL [Gemmatimonadaceae bacterium]|nr:flagellar hook-associated protein FlgL [Gemmatimonadaceae bacterium]